MRNLYAVYDLKAESIVGGIIMERLDAPAIRAFHDALDPKSNSILSQHPADFELRSLGAIDDQGVVLGYDEPATVATGAQWAAAAYLNEEATK